MDYKKEFLKEIGNVHSYDTYTVYFDMIYSAMSDMMRVDGHEISEYLGINTAKYKPPEYKAMAHAFANVVSSMDEHLKNGEFYDVLGELFHTLELHNRDKGQFFTPQHLANLLGGCSIGLEELQSQNCIDICEPSSGSGANILGLCNRVAKLGYDPQAKLRVTAYDIDIRCVAMTFVQLTLYGIPAKVVHGDTLKNETRKIFYNHWYK